MKAISLGWGLQSTALCWLSVKGKLPPVDVALFADTAFESEATYQYIQEQAGLLRAAGLRVETVQAPMVHEYLNEDTKGVWIPAFIRVPNQKKRGQLMRQCTKRWKVEPVRWWLQEHRGDADVELWLGITTDEAVRMKDSVVGYIANHYPLIDLGWSRQDVRNWLEKEGIPVPPRSACVFCPYRSESAMRQIMDNEADRAVAIKVDESIRHRMKERELFLRPELAPLEELSFGEDQFEMFAEECEGYCGL